MKCQECGSAMVATLREVWDGKVYVRHRCLNTACGREALAIRAAQEAADRTVIGKISGPPGR
ncbi:MAG: hypothetical protein JXL80_07070 [Planctomycetes bacterium]|nr:hypothetical protein [Planctomycetota bacterium]